MPTQPKKNWVKRGNWATFFPQQVIFHGFGLVFCRTDYKKPNPAKVLLKHPINLQTVIIFTAIVTPVYLYVFRFMSAKMVTICSCPSIIILYMPWRGLPGA